MKGERNISGGPAAKILAVILIMTLVFTAVPVYGTGGSDTDSGNAAAG